MGAETAPHEGARITLFPMTVSCGRHHNYLPMRTVWASTDSVRAPPRRLGSDILRKTRELSWHRCLLGSSSLSQEDQFLTSAGEISLGTGVGDGRGKNSQRVSFYASNWIASNSVQIGWMSPLEVMVDSISRANYYCQAWFTHIWLWRPLQILTNLWRLSGVFV